MIQTNFENAISLIDSANNEDPNVEHSEGKNWPKELLYSQRMSNMLLRFNSDADNVIKVAVHGQHIQRWQSPRSDYPMDRQGYHAWRSDLYLFHAEKVAQVMQQANFSQLDIERASKAIAKNGIKSNPDTQLLEDIAALVFIEHYMLVFATKHPDYTEQKWIGIIRKTWAKMSQKARDFVLSGKIVLPDSLSPLILKAVQIDAK